MRKLGVILAIVFILIGLSGCGESNLEVANLSTIRHELKINKTTLDDVIKIYGDPTDVTTMPLSQAKSMLNTNINGVAGLLSGGVAVGGIDPKTLQNNILNDSLQYQAKMKAIKEGKKYTPIKPKKDPMVDYVVYNFNKSGISAKSLIPIASAFDNSVKLKSTTLKLIFNKDTGILIDYRFRKTNREINGGIM